MPTSMQMLSVINIADVCGVARSTASYWITEKGLPAQRNGNKFMVRIDDLVLFLESLGRPIPQILVENMGGVFIHPFKQYQNCWDYWCKDPHRQRCKKCDVYNYKINECFTYKKYGSSRCASECSQCQYFYEHYMQYTSFIHQIPMPSAILKDLYIWSGNKPWADICEVEINQLIGIGIEEVIHPESIRTIINYNKRIQQGYNTEIFKSAIYFETANGKKIRANLSITPLKQPIGACLAVGENIEC